MTTLTGKDRAFLRRLENATMTVQAWDDDPSLLWEIRAILPWDDLRNETGPYAEHPTDLLRYDNPNIRFVQRLARYFQRDFMTWVNQPPCTVCGNQGGLRLHTTRGPETAEEVNGSASRVEVYHCDACNDVTTAFPRYNAPRKLLETRRGRCGEYANLFGCVCRAVGLETRYILDFTDHVWTEVRVVHDGNEEWFMVDSCEGVVNEPSMYEAGWVKKLCYMVAIAADHCVDVTWRYTRKGHTEEFQTRRRKYSSSEESSDAVVQKVCQRLMANLKPKLKGEIQNRLAVETKQLAEYRQIREWTKGYGQGRISGSLEWRLARREVGNDDSSKSNKTTKEKEASKVASFSVETFLPLPCKDVFIAVYPKPSSPREGIIVSWAKCAVGLADSISVVIVDEECLGCILQSKGFRSTEDFVAFIESVPQNRIVAVRGKLSRDEIKTLASKSIPGLLPGFRVNVLEDGILFIGQKGALPDWAFCSSFQEYPEGYQIQLSGTAIPNRDVALRTLKNTQPSSVLGRLPGEWSTASELEKRQAFLSYEDIRCSGYCTKPGMPVYLLGETAFPFQKNENEGDSEWNTFLWWPASMVPISDHGIVETSTVDASALVQVPLDLDCFQSLLGPTLQTKSGIKTTGEVLQNSRLVALYFSAAWCPPCRGTTPILAEMYETLRESHPSHGLEIVFVSSDRDKDSFENYYSKMPWTAISFENLVLFKANLSMVYGVKGIPFLVVLDPVSGQVVVPGSVSRQEFMGACQRGEAAIENLFIEWVDRVPAGTKEIMSMLEISCTEDRVESKTPTGDDESDRYLVQLTNFTDTPLPFEHAPVRSIEEDWEVLCLNRVLSHAGAYAICQVLETTLKYLENARKQPWTPKYRSFRLSNKVADTITRNPHSISFLQSLGLEVLSTQNDFIMTIPLASDLDELHEDLSAYLVEYSTKSA